VQPFVKVISHSQSLKTADIVQKLNTFTEPMVSSKAQGTRSKAQGKSIIQNGFFLAPLGPPEPSGDGGYALSP
jgi:hypothetical protein